MFMDDMKSFAENEKELETLIQVAKRYSQDMGMKLSIEKILHINNEKQEMTNNVRNRTSNLGILEANTTLLVEMKKKIKKWQTIS